MGKIACCYNCVFAYLDREHSVECFEKRILNWPACANHPESYGRMQRTPPRGICVNYRPRLSKPQGDVRQISLGDGYYAYVDAADYEWLSRWNWSIHGGYAIRRERGKQIFMHRQIMETPDELVVDHKNRNKLDNTRANLHNCTQVENAQNRPKRRDATSRFFGVSYHVHTKKYQSRLYYRHRSHFMGKNGDRPHLMVDREVSGRWNGDMARRARVVIAGCAHHVVQRGNNQQDVFFVDADRQVYFELLRDAVERFHLKVEGYCLMTNHVHLVVTPEEEAGLPSAVKRVNQMYAQYVNRMHGRRGHLWQDRYYSCTLDLPHFWRALMYIECNPVRARLCRDAFEWRWSSAGAHCGGQDPSGLLDLASWQRDMGGAQWRRELECADDGQWAKSFHLCTSRGRPLASDDTIAKLEALLGRRLRPLQHGRPRNKTS